MQIVHNHLMDKEWFEEQFAQLAKAGKTQQQLADMFKLHRTQGTRLIGRLTKGEDCSKINLTQIKVLADFIGTTQAEILARLGVLDINESATNAAQNRSIRREDPMSSEANHLLRVFSKLSAKGQLQVLAHALDVEGKEGQEAHPTARRG